MNYSRALACSAVLGLAAFQAEAATFDFEYTFDGSSISQDAGSDTADGTTLAVGDSFTLDVSAAGDDFWKVDSDFSDFVPLSYAVSDSADRTASIITTWFLDGVAQTALIETVSQAFVHVGAQTWDLMAGLMFDQVVIEWTFDAIDDPLADTTINAAGAEFFESFGDPDGSFFSASEISYNVSAAVPLPAGLPMLLGALGVFGVLRRRR